MFVSHLYESLSGNFDVKVYNYKLLYPSILFPGKTQYDTSKSLVKKIPNQRLVNSISPLNWISVAGMIKKENADLVVFDWWHPFFAPCFFAISSLLKKKYRNKILFITENVISHEGNLPDKILTRLGLFNADKFLVLSQDVFNTIREYSGKKNVYRSELPVYDWYKEREDFDRDRERERLGYKKDDLLLLFFGYIRKYKGLDILFEAVAQLKDQYPSLRLLVVGEFYEDYNFYAKKIETLGLASVVQVIDSYVPNEDVHRYYQPADLVVLPYRSATQSGILNIAYGFSKPVLVTNVGGLTESVEDGSTGIIVEPNSPEQIINGIKRYIELKDTTPFQDNIRNKVNENSFGKLPALFDRILNDDTGAER